MSGLLRFRWDEAAEAIPRALADWNGPEPRAGEGGRAFSAELDGRRLEVRVPLVLAVPRELEGLGDWLARCPEAPGRQLVLLMQAGAAALGLFDEGELLEHRTLKRYVVRGKGRAQPAYLKTKGKSRAGSRLRLRNARRLLEDVAQTLRDWDEEHGGCERVFWSCPVRGWAELLREDLPFDSEGPLVKIPMDLNRPGHEEMLRAWRALSHGSLLESGPGP